jgi:hypothetical protein
MIDFFAFLHGNLESVDNLNFTAILSPEKSAKNWGAMRTKREWRGMDMHRKVGLYLSAIVDEWDVPRCLESEVDGWIRGEVRSILLHDFWETHRERERLERVLEGRTTDCSAVSMIDRGKKGRDALKALIRLTRLINAQPCPGSMQTAFTQYPYTKMPPRSLQSLPQRQRSSCLTFSFSTVLAANSCTGTRLSL